MDCFVFNGKNTSSHIRYTNTQSAVFERSGNTGIFTGFINILYGFQAFCKSRALIGDLAVWKALTRSDSIFISYLPGRQPRHLRQQIEVGFKGKGTLRNPNPSKGACRRLVRVYGCSLDIEILKIIRSWCMGTRSLENRSAKRRIGTGIKHYFCIHAD